MSRMLATNVLGPALLGLALALSACSGGHGNGDLPGDHDESTRPFSAIAPDDTLRFIGTEPFWGGESTGTKLLYTTVEDATGQTIEIKRFAGRGGISLSGVLDDQPFDMAVSQAPCSDGMSDRTYPFTVTLKVKGEMRSGCAWTGKHAYTGTA